jgi:hypothetical protein
VAVGPAVSSRWIGRVVFVVAIAVAFGSGLALGILAGSGRLSLTGPTPEIIFVTPAPPASSEPAVTTDAVGAATSDMSGSQVATQDPGATPSPSVSPGPTAAPTPKPPTPKPATPTPARSDLAVESMSYGRATPECGKTFTVTVVIRNQGGGASKAPTIVTLADTVGLAVQANTQAGLPVMAPAQTVTLNLPLTVSTGCGQEHTLTARIDPHNAIDDGGQLNNVDSLTYFLAA